jgi:hypothetical protein
MNYCRVIALFSGFEYSLSWTRWSASQPLQSQIVTAPEGAWNGAVADYISKAVQL